MDVMNPITTYIGMLLIDGCLSNYVAFIYLTAYALETKLKKKFRAKYITTHM